MYEVLMQETEEEKTNTETIYQLVTQERQRTKDRLLEVTAVVVMVVMVKYGAMKKGQQWCVYSFLDCPQGW